MDWTGSMKSRSPDRPGLPRFAKQPEDVPDFPEVAEEIRPEVARRLQPLPDVRPESGGGEPRRLGEGDQIGWDGHPHVMASPEQLAADRDPGLDIAASSIKREHEFHDVIPARYAQVPPRR